MQSLRVALKGNDSRSAETAVCSFPVRHLQRPPRMQLGDRSSTRCASDENEAAPHERSRLPLIARTASTP